jgi:hypothetical protein
MPDEARKWLSIVKKYENTNFIVGKAVCHIRRLLAANEMLDSDIQRLKNDYQAIHLNLENDKVELEAENARLLEGHKEQWEETYFCYVCRQHEHSEDCPLYEDCPHSVVLGEHECAECGEALF